MPFPPLPSAPPAQMPTVPNLLQAFPTRLPDFGIPDLSIGGIGNFPNAYLLDMEDNSRLEFQFIPTDTNENKSASYHEHDILGRSTPILAYMGSAARIVSLTLQFFVAPFQGDTSPGLQDIKDHVDWLRSLVWPDYSKGIKPPHRILVHLGDVIAMESVCTDYSLSIPHGGIWDNARFGPGLAHAYDVKLNFKEVRAIPPGLTDIRGGDRTNAGGNSGAQGYGNPFEGAGTADSGLSGT